VHYAVSGKLRSPEYRSPPQLRGPHKKRSRKKESFARVPLRNSGARSTGLLRTPRAGLPSRSEAPPAVVTVIPKKKLSHSASGSAAPGAGLPSPSAATRAGLPSRSAAPPAVVTVIPKKKLSHSASGSAAPGAGLPSPSAAPPAGNTVGLRSSARRKYRRAPPPAPKCVAGVPRAGLPSLGATGAGNTVPLRAPSLPSLLSHPAPVSG
jgi:hypothetical protein